MIVPTFSIFSMRDHIYLVCFVCCTTSVWTKALCLVSRYVHVVVPISKHKTGNLAEKATTNCHPISLATIISNVFYDNLFGFRTGLSAGSAILSFKYTVTYYTKRKIPLYACFLHLSRTFDLVSYIMKKIEVHITPEWARVIGVWGEAGGVEFTNALQSIRKRVAGSALCCQRRMLHRRRISK